MKLVRLVSVALVAGAFAAIGCSSSEPTVFVKGDTGLGDTKVTDTGSTPNDTAVADTGTLPGACDVTAGVNCTTAGCGDANKCFECMSNGDKAGYQAYVTALTGACACKTGATCYSTCSATQVCGGSNTNNTPCVTCINGLADTDACLADFKTACTGACAAFINKAATDCK